MIRFNETERSSPDQKVPESQKRGKLDSEVRRILGIKERSEEAFKAELKRLEGYKLGLEPEKKDIEYSGFTPDDFEALIQRLQQEAYGEDEKAR